MNTSDINITVNGNRCKQYNHEGKTFIQANNGSEYVIEIKNNSYKRILAVCSVDGLNVLTGKTAAETDSGYIIGAYDTEKIKGFRFSDDEWALFKFGFKFNGKTYAQAKNDGSEINCGAIGIRLFYEKEVEVVKQYIYSTNWPVINPPLGYYDNNTTYNTYVNDSLSFCDMGTINNDNLLIKGSSGMSTTTNYINQLSTDTKGFDMGTEWGKREKSKVHSVSFERGILAQSLDIYYASRESLIEMGVPLTNRLKANLPQSFPGKYAEPPKHWQG